MLNVRPQNDVAIKITDGKGASQMQHVIIAK